MKTSMMLLLTILSLQSVAQEISGRVLDEKKEPVISAIVQAYQNGIIKGGTATDYDGNYTLKPLAPGAYNVLVLYAGYDSVMTTDVVVDSGNRTTLNFNLKPRSVSLKSYTVTAYAVPLVDRDSKSTILTRKEIDVLPTTNVVSLSGARTTGSVYIIDGLVVRGATGVNMAQGSISTRKSAHAKYYKPSEESYKKHTENDFMNVKSTPVSTMSVDVDRASYSNIRRFINGGQKPPADAVRTEEMINYFDYEYPQPKGEDPIAISTELTDCPWQKGHNILRIGMQAKKIDMERLPPSNLVFLIDVSGSMESPDKLTLLIAGMKLLVQNLRPIDKVAIVTYAGNAGLVLPPVNGDRKQTILDALDKLRSGGSTAGGAGIKLAYKTAQDNFIKGGNNRVLLATDGDFNVGVSSDNELEDLITKERETGIFLTCLGFGMGNYKDSKLEMLADKGNGNYAYIDNLPEAQKVLVHEFGGTLFTVAKDVKAQIEFNPAKVQGYRLVGYENRLLNTEDFKDDKKDAGDMGSGHTVTIMYEIIPVGVESKHMRSTHRLRYQKPEVTDETTSDELATIKFRYKKPDAHKSKEMTHTIAYNSIAWEDASENTRFSASVAMFGMLLKDSKYKGTCSYDEVIEIAANSDSFDKEGYRAAFIGLVKAAKDIKPIASAE